MVRILILACLVAIAATAEGPIARHGVSVALSVEGSPTAPVLVAAFTPDRRTPPLHLYGKDLPTGGAGLATRLELAPGAPVAARGPLTDDQPTKLLLDLPVYPDGATVTLRLPITPPAGDGSPVAVPVLLSWMACTEETCLPPVRRLPAVVQVRSSPAAAQTQAPALPEPPAAAVAAPASSAIAWRKPATVAEVEALIAQAHAAGRNALLDFTGPSCINCQVMAKTVFRLPGVIAGWNSGVPIEIDTDHHPELADWQQQRFQTQARPLYVRLAPGGAAPVLWDKAFPISDRAKVDGLQAFLNGHGPGSAEGAGQDWGAFIALAIAGGLFTLIMPCTYPMIPFTVSFFAKQAKAGAKPVPLAIAYGLGIIACFVGLGVVITGVFGASLATVAGSPFVNFAIAALFVVMGLSLLGAFLLRLPGGLEGVLGGSRGGYVGALVMGLTFAVTAFTCTAPFAGSVLAAAVATGTWGTAMLGMAIYASVIAIPFTVLAAVPGLLAKLPKAGAWMDEAKVVGGLIEIAAALKFLVICDVAWSWGLFGRTSVLVAWTAIALVTALYLLGRIRLHDDPPVERMGVGRLLTATMFLAIAIACAAGLAGTNLGIVESFFPGDAAP